MSSSRKTPYDHRGPAGRLPRAARHDRTSDDYTRLVPDVDTEWVEAFVLEQRLLDVPGDRIGDALALVQSHVADSGESAHDAFGDPKQYARQAAPQGRPADERGTGWFLGSLLGLAGLMLTSTGADSWLFGDGALEVSAGLLVAAVLAVSSCIALVVRPDPFLRLVVDRPWIAVGAVVLWTLLAAAAVAFLRTPVAQAPAGVVTSTGVVLLVVSTALEWRTKVRGTLEDPIVGPGESTQRASGGWAGWLTVFLFPVLAVLLLALSWVLDALA